MAFFFYFGFVHVILSPQYTEQMIGSFIEFIVLFQRYLNISMQAARNNRAGNAEKLFVKKCSVQPKSHSW